MNVLEREQELFLPTYNRLPIEINRGEGYFLYDTNGKKYLDFLGGLAVNTLGHAHPKIVEQVSKQIARFAHLSNLFVTDVHIAFTEKLLKYSNMHRAFLTNSGTEAVEGAIKILRGFYGADKTIFSMSNSFHGRTYGAMTLTDKAKYKEPFKPLLPNIDTIVYNDLEDLRSKVDSNTAAVFIEFLQGEGGIFMASEEFAAELSALRDQYGFAIVSDSIQCGIGRTGKPFSHDFFNVKPDIILSAKAIGGGLPLGAILTNEKFATAIKKGEHGTTFGGNAVCCAAGLVVLEEVFENGLMENAKKIGDYLKSEIAKVAAEFPGFISEIRGEGLMIGIDVKPTPSAPIVTRLLEKGIIANSTHDTVIRLLPPLIIDTDAVNLFIDVLREVIREFNQQASQAKA